MKKYIKIRNLGNCNLLKVMHIESSIGLVSLYQIEYIALQLEPEINFKKSLSRL